MKPHATLLGLALATTALAQTTPVADAGLEKATFGMVKTTLEFLATDQKTFGTAKKLTCDNCLTYNDLTTFIKTNNLKKADLLVNDIKKQSAALSRDFTDGVLTSQGAVQDSLRRYVVNRVTSGPERVHRTKLASFAAYQTRMTALAGNADPEQAATDQAAANQEETVPANLTSEAEQTPVRAGGGLGTWAFWLAVLNALGLVYLWLTRRQGGGGTTNTDKADARLAGLQDESNRLSSTVADLANRLTMAEKKLVQQNIQAAQNRPAQPTPVDPPRRAEAPTDRPAAPTTTPGSNQPRPGYGNPANPVIPPAGTLPPDAPRPVPAEPVAAPPKLFARTADLGNGFSISGLLEQATRGIVYEITPTGPATATYQVSQLPESQQLAMSDPYSYLNDACLYENQPGGANSRIQTVEPGQLVLQGDKWHITEKARIGFV